MKKNEINPHYVFSKIIMTASSTIWGTCNIEDLGKWATGCGFPIQYQGELGHPYLFCKVGDMNRTGNEMFISSTENTINSVIARTIKAKIHPRGTVIFPKIGGAIATNKRRILVKESAIDNNCLGIIPNKNIDSEWLYHFLSSIDLSLYQSGTSVPALKQSVIEKLPAPLIPIEIQKQIAHFLTWLNNKSPEEILSKSPPLPQELEKKKRIIATIERFIVKIDEARRERARVFECVDSLLMRQLKKIRIANLEKYPNKKIGEIFEVTSGGTPSREISIYWNGDIPWIKTGELRDNDIFAAEEHITKEGLEYSATKLFPKETILIALYGQGQTRGRTARLMIEATTNQACCAILPQPEIMESRFLQYWLRGLYYEMRENYRDGAQPNWNGKMIKEIIIAIPPLSEQRYIVANLDRLLAKVDEAKKLQVETDREMVALVPAVLAKAFGGVG